MKNIKSILGLWMLVIWLTCFSNNSFARSMSNNPCYMSASANTPNNQWSWVERWENDWVYYLNWNIDWTYTYKYNNETWDNLSQLDSWNAWDYFACNLDYYSSSVNWRRQSNYNFIKVYKPSTLWETSWQFYRWNESSRTYRQFNTSWLWYVDDDWVAYDMWFPWHWTIVLYSSETKRTIQFIWKHVIRDKIVFFDPLENDQNLWIISFVQGKAWSTNMQSDYRYYLFWMWDLDDEMMSDLDLEYSYDILTWGTYFWPNTAWQLSIGPTSPTNWHRIGRYTEVAQMWLTFTYQTDLEYEPPVFIWGSNDYWSWQWVSSDMQAWNNYQACERETSFKNFIVDSWISCRSDYQNWQQDYTGFRAVNDFIMQANIWNENITWELAEYFSWIDLSYNCQALLNNSVALVKLYNVIWKDPGQYFDVMNELKYITKSDPYDITQQCWERPAVPTEYQPVNNSSNVCNLDSWSNIINCFSFWSSDAGSWTSYFEVAINNIQAMIWNAFDSKLLSPIKDQFNEWKWLLSKKWLSCDSDNVLLNIPYIDYVVYLLAVLVLFLLFTVL